MRKPFAADELLHRIESLLPAAGRPAPAVAPPQPAAAAPPAPVAAPVIAPERGASQPAPASSVAEPVTVGAAAPTPTPDLKALLAGVAELAGVYLTALIDREGALLEVAGGLLPEAELAGALAACLVESTDESAPQGAQS
jgi:hypothetical protein